MRLKRHGIGGIDNVASVALHVVDVDVVEIDVRIDLGDKCRVVWRRAVVDYVGI